MTMTLTEYWDQLNKHDWYYAYSDDYRVCREGDKVRVKLRDLRSLSPAHAKLFDEFHKHYFTGRPWGTAKAPKPTRPVDETFIEKIIKENKELLTMLATGVFCPACHKTALPPLANLGELYHWAEGHPACAERTKKV